MSEDKISTLISLLADRPSLCRKQDAEFARRDREKDLAYIAKSMAISVKIYIQMGVSFSSTTMYFPSLFLIIVP